MATFLCAAGAPPQAQAIYDVLRIGILNDQSGLYADLAGPDSVLAAQMAAEDFGGKVLNVPIEIVSGDHQNKPDIGSAIMRPWLSNETVSPVADVPKSSVTLAAQDVMREKQKVFLISGAATADLSGKNCSPFSIQTADDTDALSVGTTRAVVESGADTWFSLTADYAFGHTSEAEATRIIIECGGKVLGDAYHPRGTADYAAYLLQAQASHAKAISLANAGNDTINAIKQANEFGLTAGSQKLVRLILFISDIHALGLGSAHGLLPTQGSYWDISHPARSWSHRFEARFGRMPTRAQAAACAGSRHRQFENRRRDDEVHADGLFWANRHFPGEGSLHAQADAVRAQAAWDYYKLVRTIPAATAFHSVA